MHKLTHLIFFVFLQPYISFAQSAELAERIDQAQQLEYIAPDSALSVYRNVREEAHARGLKEIATKSIYYQGLVYMQLGKFDSCEILLRIAEDEYENLSNHVQHAKVLIALANNFYFQSKYEIALASYQNALDAAIPIDDPLMQARILSNQSSIFNVTGRIESALGCLRRARSLAEPLGSSVFLADIYNNFAVNFQGLYRYDSATHYAREAANMYQLVDSDLYQALALTNLSGYLLEHPPPKLEESKFSLDKSRTILDTLNAPNIEINYWKHLAYYHFKKEEYDLALQYSLVCLEWIDLNPDLPSERNIYEFLYKIFKEQGHIDSSLKYHEKYTEARDTLIFKESRAQLQDLQTKYESIKKDEEIAQQNLVINKRTSERNLFSFSLLITGLLIWFFADRYKKNKKLSAEKIQNLEKYQKIMVLDSMLLGQQEERKRIAQDLHDGLGTLLVSARLQMQNAQRQIEKIGHLPILQNTESLIDNACKEVRRIAHDMMPSALIDLGFVDAVADLVNELRSSQSVLVEFNAPDPMPHLDDTISLNLYRIVQEVLQNVLKHARAKIVGVNIIVESPNNLIIEISDDGVGFDSEASEAGLGLSNIKSRVEYLNGKMRLESKINQGCTYSLVIPLTSST